MSLPRLRRLAVAFLCVGLLVPFAPGATSQDLEEVERQVEELEGTLQAATERWNETRATIEAAETELQQLEARAVELEDQAVDADRAIADQVRAMFMYGGDPVLASLMSADGPQGAIERASLMSALNGRQRAQLEEAVALRTQLDQTEQLVQDRAADLRALEARLEVERNELDAQLRARQAVATDLRQRAARQRQIDRGVQNGTYACIHDSNSFVDSWGDPRSGGRRHKGVDVMAPYDVPTYAFTDGRISRLTQGGLGGISLYLWGDDGNEYFYTHLAGYAPGISVGTRVEAGQLVAYNGDTGNARGTPHVHFEVHPGGGSPVNPYQWMAAACF